MLRDYLRQVRPEFVAPPAFQRTVYLPGAIGQIDWASPPMRAPRGRRMGRAPWNARSAT